MHALVQYTNIEKSLSWTVSHFGHFSSAHCVNNMLVRGLYCICGEAAPFIVVLQIEFFSTALCLLKVSQNQDSLTVESTFVLNIIRLEINHRVDDIVQRENFKSKLTMQKILVFFLATCFIVQITKLKVNLHVK